MDAKPRTFRLVKDLFSRMNESEYEVMQLKQYCVIYYYILSLKFRFTCTLNDVGVMWVHRFYCKNTSKTLYLITLYPK